VLQQAGALPDGSSWMRGAAAGLKPEPLTAPARPARALSTETRDLVGSDRREAAERVLEKPALAPQETDGADAEGDPDAELESEGSARNA
jgi:glutathione-regulated potassium-efflux system protein KefB